tara:strand:+ start:2239 stop:2367 length:129 start_codon:yes stop_codon:yes gene_type:complete
MPFAICLYGYTGHTDGRNGYGEKINQVPKNCLGVCTDFPNNY